MRGRRDAQNVIFVVADLESVVPEDHPLRRIKPRVDEELRRLGPVFNQAYAQGGRPSVPPERLVKATLLQALFSIRSERQLCEQIGYSMLFRWFLDMRLDEEVWDHSTFSKNRQRLFEHGILARFFEGSVARAISEEATSDDHFSVDGTLIEAWASMKSFRPKGESDDDPSAPSGRNGWKDFKGEKRSNRTHACKTDPEALLARKGDGQASMLAHSMHVLMENRHGLIMDVRIAQADGHAEREQAEVMVRAVRARHWLRPKTLGLDKGYWDGDFLDRLEREHRVVPHVAVPAGKIAADDAGGQARRRARRRQRTVGYQISQIVRRRIEPAIGWMKQIAGLEKTRFIGQWKTQMYAFVASAAYNFLRLAHVT
jgi:transposase